MIYILLVYIILYQVTYLFYSILVSLSLWDSSCHFRHAKSIRPEDHIWRCFQFLTLHLVTFDSKKETWSISRVVHGCSVFEPFLSKMVPGVIGAIVSAMRSSIMTTLFIQTHSFCCFPTIPVWRCLICPEIWVAFCGYLKQRSHFWTSAVYVRHTLLPSGGNAVSTDAHPLVQPDAWVRLSSLTPGVSLRWEEFMIWYELWEKVVPSTSGFTSQFGEQ